MQRGLVGLAASAALFVAVPRSAPAQGFQVNEHGTCVMGRAGTGVAQPCADGSSVYYNPAGIAGMQGITVSAGLLLIDAFGGFTDDSRGETTDLANPLIPVPHFYATYAITDRITAGIGGFLPYGLGTEWPITFEGRFIGYDNDLRSIYIQPTLAYQLNEQFAIGAGFDFVIGSIELNQRQDFSAQQAPAPAPAGTTVGQLGIPFHTDFANSKLKATGATGIGGNFGIWVRPTDRLSLGARYLTRVKLDYSGTATFDPVSTGIILPESNPFGVPGGTPLDVVIAALNLFSGSGPLVDGDVSATIRMPEQLTAGVAVDVTPSLKLLGEWQWVNWSIFDQLVADFANPATPDLTLEENFEDTHAFRFGFEWLANEQWTLRGGYLFHQAAEPDHTVTPLLPEGRRNEFTGGVGLRINERFSADVAYQYLRQDKRRGRVRNVPLGTAPSVVVSDFNSGLYDFKANLVSATITARF